MRRSTVFRAAVICGILAAAGPAFGWHDEGHIRIARLAVAGLPAEMPAFFRQNAEAIAGWALQPDMYTRPIAPPELHAAAGPEHYFDSEWFTEPNLPADRYGMLDWCAQHKLSPGKVGLLPYALTEGTQRLAVAFAEYRLWPNDANVQQRCLAYAGILCHYAGDLEQPLHTTIHYDGRADEKGKSPRSGIHLKTDALAGKLGDYRGLVPDANTLSPVAPLLPGILAEIRASHAKVDTLYALESKVPDKDSPITDPAVLQFTRERTAAGAKLSARLFLTAWRMSKELDVPVWHRRPEDVRSPVGKQCPLQP